MLYGTGRGFRISSKDFLSSAPTKLEVLRNKSLRHNMAPHGPTIVRPEYLSERLKEEVKSLLDITDLNQIKIVVPSGLTDWIMVPLYLGLFEWWKLEKDPQIFSWLLRVCDSVDWKLGPRKYLADDHAIGQLYLSLRKHCDNSRGLGQILEQFFSILNDPPQQDMSRSSGVKRWTWSDALFMSPPIWCELYSITEELQFLEYFKNEWWAAVRHLFVSEDKLFVRDENFIRPDNNIYWCRGNGWVLAGLSLILPELSKNSIIEEEDFVNLFKELTEGVLSRKNKFSLWDADLGSLDKTFPTEVSGSALILFGLARGIRTGFLSESEYFSVVQKGISNLKRFMSSDGRITNVQPPAAQPEVFNTDQSYPYGTGAFLMALAEAKRLLEDV